MPLGACYLYKFVKFYLFIYLFIQKVKNNRLKKKPIGQNFVLLFFCSCLK